MPWWMRHLTDGLRRRTSPLRWPSTLPSRRSPSPPPQHPRRPSSRATTTTTTARWNGTSSSSHASPPRPSSSSIPIPTAPVPVPRHPAHHSEDAGQHVTSRTLWPNAAPSPAAYATCAQPYSTPFTVYPTSATSNLKRTHGGDDSSLQSCPTLHRTMHKGMHSACKHGQGQKCPGAFNRSAHGSKMKRISHPPEGVRSAISTRK